MLAASSTRSSVPVNPTTANHAGTLNRAAAAEADTTANSSSVNRTVTLFGRPPSTRVRREPRITLTTPHLPFAQRSVPTPAYRHPRAAYASVCPTTDPRSSPNRRTDGCSDILLRYPGAHPDREPEDAGAPSQGPLGVGWAPP